MKITAGANNYGQFMSVRFADFRCILLMQPTIFYVYSQLCHWKMLIVFTTKDIVVVEVVVEVAVKQLFTF